MTTTQLVVTLVGGAAAGALITGLVTLFTGSLTRRNEQRRWLLDKRLDVYAEFQAALDAWVAAFVDDEMLDMGKPTAAVRDAYQRMKVVAPDDVRWQAVQLYTKINSFMSDGDDDWLGNEEKELVFIVSGMAELSDLERVDVQSPGRLRRLATWLDNKRSGIG